MASWHNADPTTNPPKCLWVICWAAAALSTCPALLLETTQQDFVYDVHDVVL